MMCERDENEIEPHILIHKIFIFTGCPQCCQGGETAAEIF